jgi:glycosyltransferase involved in cell wall biosynthesis
MKTIHITAAKTGGAGNAAYSFFDLQTSMGINSKFIASIGKLTLSSFFTNPVLTFAAILDRAGTKDRKSMFFSILRSKLSKDKISHIRDSIVHLHWIPGSVSTKNLKKLSINNLKVYVHLHDMWFLTGGCHHSLNCMKFTKDCSNCPNVYRVFHNLVFELRLSKIEFLKLDNVFLVAPSSWIKNLIKQADEELYEKSCLVPNPVDVNRFKPLSKSLAKKILGIDSDCFVIGFVAANLEESNKGVVNFIHFLEKNFDALPFKLKILLMGNGNIKTHLDSYKINFTTISTEISIAYSAMDIFVNTSKVESFSYTNIEASLHKTPVLSISNGGSNDTVSEGVSGFSVQSYAELLARIIELYNNKEEYMRLSDLGPEFIYQNFSYQAVGNKLLQMYDN